MEKEVQEDEEEEEEEDQEDTTAQPQRPAPQRVDTTISKNTDKQVLRDFLSGDHCLQGVRDTIIL